MLNNYWYKALGTTNGKTKTLEGSLKAETADGALALVEGYKNTWVLSKISAIYIYDIDQFGETHEDHVVFKDFSTNPLPPTLPLKQEKVSDIYDRAAWLRVHEKTINTYPVVTMKEIQS